MTIDDINATSFIDARSFEIENLEKSLQETRKKSLLFQRLPFHKRRRARSKHVNKSRFSRRKNIRQKEKFIYYHKRFKMINFLNSYLPLQRREKSDSFIYKSEDRGYLWIENYKKAFLYVKKEILNEENGLGIEILDLEFDNLILLNHDNEQYEIFKHDNFVIVVSIKQPEIFNYSYVRDLGTPISIMKGKITFSCNIKENLLNDKDPFIDLTKENVVKTKRELKYNKVGVDIYFENVIVLPKSNDVEKYKIIVDNTMVRILHDVIVKQGIIPVSIFELFRINLENKSLIYPFDYPSTSYYPLFEKSVYSEEYLKWQRTPPGKRINYEKLNVPNPWFLPIDFNISRKIYIAYFDILKGTAKRMSQVYKNNEVVGYVLRASYCFTIGKCRGVCALLIEPTGDFKIRNIKDYIDISIIK